VASLSKAAPNRGLRSRKEEEGDRKGKKKEKGWLKLSPGPFGKGDQKKPKACCVVRKKEASPGKKKDGGGLSPRKQLEKRRRESPVFVWFFVCVGVLVFLSLGGGVLGVLKWVFFLFLGWRIGMCRGIELCFF